MMNSKRGLITSRRKNEAREAFGASCFSGASTWVLVAVFLFEIAYRLLSLPGMSQAVILAVFATYIIATCGITWVARLSLYQVLLILFCLSEALMGSVSFGRIMNAFSWILFFLGGFALFEKMGWNGARRFFIWVRNIVLVACFFGLVLQYGLHLAFSTDTFVRAGTDTVTFSVAHLNDPFGWRMCSFFSHPIVFGDFVVISICVTAVLSEGVPSKVVMLSVLCLCLVLTQTRGAWIASIAVLILLLIWCRDRDVHAWHIAAVAMPAVLFAILMLHEIGAIDFIANRLASLEYGNGVTARVDAIELLWQVYSNDSAGWFFGHGYGSASEIISNSSVGGNAWAVVDNQYVTLLYDFGAIPLAVFLVGMASFFWSYHKRGMDEVAFSGVVGIVLTSLIAMCFYDLFSWMSISMLLFSTIGLLSAALQSESQALLGAEKER